MERQDLIDICETMHGKLTQALNWFYWSEDGTKLIDIRTGENLVAHVQFFNRHDKRSVRYCLRSSVKIMKRGVVIVDKEGILNLYNSDCDLIMRVQRNVVACRVKEYISKSESLAIYLLGQRTVASYMKVAVVDLKENKMITYHATVDRFYEENGALQLIVFDGEKLDTVKYKL